MVNPLYVTKHNQTISELQEFVMFWILAAGKNGVTAAKCLDKLLTTWKVDGLSPFQTIKYIAENVDLAQEMKKHGIGCYNHKAKSFLQLVNSNIDLVSCSVEELESIRGIGPKTARCYLIHSRPNQKYAGLDRHCLSFLRDQGHDVPKATPTGNKYRELEKLFLKYVEQSGQTVSEFDLSIWRKYRNKNEKNNS